MKYKEIVKVLKNKLSGVECLDNREYDEEELGLGEITEMKDGRTGGCDEGSDYNRVFYFKDHDVYININGFYQSYNGVEFDGWNSLSEVRPKEKLITVYE